MNTFLRSEEFDAWLLGLKDRVGRARIVHRIRSAELGNFGDCVPVGEGVSEMRIHTGQGYRAYYTRRDDVVYLLHGRRQVHPKAGHQARHRHGAVVGEGVSHDEICPI